MTKQFPNIDVDGDQLRFAREAKGLTLKELGLKVCLSHQHIAQLENNQATIFFTPSHKIQVAKKVGAALGLKENDYLIELPENKDEVETPLPTNNQAPLSIELLTKSKQEKKSAFGLHTLAFSILIIAVGSMMFFNESTNLYVRQLVGSDYPIVIEPIPSNDNLSIEKIETTMLTSQEPIEAQKVSTVTAANPCAYEKQNAMTYRTANPSKSGEMVYMMSKETQTICVIDSQNKMTTFNLEAGQSKTIFGQAPFTIVSSDLEKIELYFQGWKVKPQTNETNIIRLEATDLAQN
ncbi:helix-turn-helix domain-containing protein [Polynucleobacter kasalickyi]|uniref:Helix-turn-helix n=1 Tax=Polynucleobacter kasalickyi TaxID=1938817 RepID=A0A1W2B568_9BURK|nr:helix-turn-helix domain-containing protein [Polynucleobacter kasalickyi]SMC67984.1 Helix-turn-helix [Polynucleobacter kasalickyi]